MYATQQQFACPTQRKDGLSESATGYVYVVPILVFFLK